MDLRDVIGGSRDLEIEQAAPFEDGDLRGLLPDMHAHQIAPQGLSFATSATPAPERCLVESHRLVDGHSLHRCGRGAFQAAIGMRRSASPASAPAPTGASGFAAALAHAPVTGDRRGLASTAAASRPLRYRTLTSAASDSARAIVGDICGHAARALSAAGAGRSAGSAAPGRARRLAGILLRRAVRWRGAGVADLRSAGLRRRSPSRPDRLVRG